MPLFNYNRKTKREGERERDRKKEKEWHTLNVTIWPARSVSVCDCFSVLLNDGIVRCVVMANSAKIVHLHGYFTGQWRQQRSPLVTLYSITRSNPRAVTCHERPHAQAPDDPTFSRQHFAPPPSGHQIRSPPSPHILICGPRFSPPVIAMAQYHGKLSSSGSLSFLL
jgi:hypothetical protein